MTAWVLQNSKTGEFIGICSKDGSARRNLKLTKKTPRLYSAERYAIQALNQIAGFNNLVVKQVTVEVNNYDIFRHYDR